MRTLFKSTLFLLLMLPMSFFAQNTVTGNVSESATGLPIPGANVIVQGTTNGAVTDFDGNYSISNVAEGDILTFSYLGFATKEITYSGQSTIDVILEEDSAALDEVLVIGYGSVNQKDATGAVEQVGTEEFNQGPIQTAGQLLTGKVPGVTVTSGGGAPGEGESITIRGQGSLSLTSSPLIVVDGIPLANDNIAGSRNALDFINPNDIESMTILKDASSTAIYGSRAANGVIMITTKKGKGNEFKFNFTTATSVYAPTEYVDVMDGDQFRALINDIGNENDIARLGTEDTNWQREIYNTAFGSEHNFSATGRIGNFMPVRASIGHTDQDGVLIGDNFTRTTGSVNVRPNFLEDQLRVEINARGMYTENTFANRDAIGSSVDFDPTQSIFDKNSPFGGYFTWLNADNNQINLAPTNPVALINLKDDTSEVRRFIGNAKVDYDLFFLPELTATVNVGYDISDSNGRVITSEQMPSASSDWNGSFTRYSNEFTNKLFDAYLTYDNDFDLHSVNAVAGYSYQSFEQYTYNFDSETQEDGLEFEFVDRNKNVLLSYFGRLNYGFDNRYLVTATLRADASSKLNPDDRWGYFPSFALAWNINNESFLNSSSVVDQLKLRLGYGEIGNVNGLGDYNFLTNYIGSRSDAYYQFGNQFYQTYRPQGINEDLRWEIGKTYNIGLDYAFFNSRISGSVNAYIKETEDLISFVTVDPFTNFSNQIDANIGDMENRGIEFAVNVVPVKNDNFTWNIGYNISYNDNEITNLPDQVEVGDISGGTGNRIQLHKEGYTPFSYWVLKQVYDENGRPVEGAFVDRNGDNQINNEDKYLYKDPYADIIMGLNTNLNYKNWDFSVVTRANLGNYAYNNMASSKSFETRATANGILRNLHSDYYNTGFVASTENSLVSDYYIQDASFFKLDNITLGYTIPNLFEDASLRIYGNALNVLMVTEYEGLDPEINGGIDNNFYPRPRTFSIGANLNF